MIDDILFASYQILFYIPSGPLGTQILGYSMDGIFYDFEQTIVVGGASETSHIFVS
jgi:hypothetical protein